MQILSAKFPHIFCKNCIIGVIISRFVRCSCCCFVVVVMLIVLFGFALPRCSTWPINSSCSSGESLWRGGGSGGIVTNWQGWCLRAINFCNSFGFSSCQTYLAAALVSCLKIHNVYARCAWGKVGSLAHTHTHTYANASSLADTHGNLLPWELRKPSPLIMINLHQFAWAIFSQRFVREFWLKLPEFRAS